MTKTKEGDFWSFENFTTSQNFYFGGWRGAKNTSKQAKKNEKN